MFDRICDDERLALLKSQIEYARSRSRFYTDTLRGWEITSLSGLAELPFTDKHDISEHGKQMICVSASEIERIVSLRSSGTESAPKRLYFTRGDLERTVDFFRDGMGRICERGDRTAILLPCSSPNGVGDLLRRGLQKAGTVPLSIGILRSRDDLDRLAAEKPDVLVGMPWQVRLAAMTHPEMKVKKILLSADYLPDGMRGFIENLWHCTVLDHYGLTESGYGCAVETERGGGMRLRSDELIAEVIDPKTLRPLGDGEPGELVITTLRREAMPLIRYRTGDLAVLSDSGRIIRRICGRKDVPQAFYKAQDVLCRTDWLYDYRQGDGVSFASVKSDAPDDARDKLAAVLGGSVKITRGENGIRPAYAEKRTSDTGQSASGMI